MARMNMGLMLGSAAAAGLGLWWLMGRKRVSAPSETIPPEVRQEMDLVALVGEAVKNLKSPEEITRTRSLLSDVGERLGEDFLRNASSYEIQKAMEAEELDRAMKYESALIHAIDDEALMTSVNPVARRPPDGTIIAARDAALAQDPEAKLLDVATMTAMLNAGALPVGTLVVFVSATAPTSYLGRGFTLMNVVDLNQRAAAKGVMLLGGKVSSSGTAGYDDYVQMPYSGYGAQYGVRSGAGVTGQGF